MTSQLSAQPGKTARAEPQTFRARDLMAALTVRDLEKSVAWYRDVIGFIVEQRHERSGKLVAVSMKAGRVEILLGLDDGAKGFDRQKGEGMSLQLTTLQSVDELAARIKSHGGTLHTEPMDTPWGARVFRIVDPDGFKLVFSSAR
jgi:lactoylglutathione lyase